MQCEQFVELTSFIGKEYSKVVVLSRARTTTFVLLSCEEANWDLLCDSMGSRPYCWRQQAKTEELYVFFLRVVSSLCACCEYCNLIAKLRFSSHLFTGFKVVWENPMSSIVIVVFWTNLWTWDVDSAFASLKLSPIFMTNRFDSLNVSKYLSSLLWYAYTRDVFATNLLLWLRKVSSFITFFNACLKRCLGSVSEGVLNPPGGFLEVVGGPFWGLLEAFGSLLRCLGRV